MQLAASTEARSAAAKAFGASSASSEDSEDGSGDEEAGAVGRAQRAENARIERELDALRQEQAAAADSLMQQVDARVLVWR
jgi:hypothetical protein